MAQAHILAATFVGLSALIVRIWPLTEFRWGITLYLIGASLTGIGVTLIHAYPKGDLNYIKIGVSASVILFFALAAYLLAMTVWTARGWINWAMTSTISLAISGEVVAYVVICASIQGARVRAGHIQALKAETVASKERVQAAKDEGGA